MGTIKPVRRLWCSVLLYLSTELIFCNATFISADSVDRNSPRLTDVNLIKCDVCRYLAKAALEGGERLLSTVSELVYDE